MFRRLAAATAAALALLGINATPTHGADLPEAVNAWR